MSVYNNSGTLAQAVRSILNQSYQDWELLLIDDGSTDNSLDIARSFNDSRIKVLSDGLNKRLSTRLNEAIELAQGDYFARLDGDDICYPQRFQKQIDYLEAHPEVDLVGARVMTFNDAGDALGKRAFPEHHKAICARPTSGFPLAHPTFCGRIAWYKQQRYRPEVNLCDDQDLLLRSYQKSRFANVPEILLGYRESEPQISKLLKTRRIFAKCLWREFNRQHKLLRAVRAVAGQGLKAMNDLVGCYTGLGKTLLRHRAQPISDEEQREWKIVFDSVRS